MAFDIVLGRSKKDTSKFGTRGTIFLGKEYVKMGETMSLSNRIFMDVTRTHVVFVVGKRGGGKSYTLGVISEGVAGLEPEIRNNLSVILLDTMGVYWTMRYPNRKDSELLSYWNIEGKSLNVRIFVPSGFFDDYKKKGIPVDSPFSIRPADLTPEDWCTTFSLDVNSPAGVLIARLVLPYLAEDKSFSIKEIVQKALDNKEADPHVCTVVANLFRKVGDWGIFSKDGTPLVELSKAGQVTVLDMSAYATLPSGWLIKNLVVGLTSKKLFNQRMLARKDEEFNQIDYSMHYFKKEAPTELKYPLVWLILDEAHEMLPRHGKTSSSDALITILREGRQPGISLILASQQPGKIHTDVMTQTDIFISHRLTAQLDIESLGALMQTYMREGLGAQLEKLPRMKGAALVFDDSNEKIFVMQVRPRITWHGGSSPTAMVEKKKMF